MASLEDHAIKAWIDNLPYRWAASGGLPTGALLALLTVLGPRRTCYQSCPHTGQHSTGLNRLAVNRLLGAMEHAAVFSAIAGQRPSIHSTPLGFGGRSARRPSSRSAPTVS